MSAGEIQALIEQSFAGINWKLFTEGQFLDTAKNIILGIIAKAKEQAGGEEGLENMVLGFVRPFFDRWADSNKFPAFVDSLFWNLLERSVRAAI